MFSCSSNGMVALLPAILTLLALVAHLVMAQGLGRRFGVQSWRSVGFISI